MDDQPEKNAEEFWEEYPNADDINYVSLIRGLKLHLQRSNRLNSSVHPEDILSDSAQFEDILSYTDYSYLHTLLSEINLQTLIKPKTELAVFSKCCHLLNNKPENVRTSKTEELNPFLEKLVSYSEELENEALTKKLQDTIDKFKCAAQDPLIVGKLGKSNRGRDSISTRFQSQSNMWGEEYFVAPLCKIIDDTFQQNHRRVDFLTAAIFTDPLVSPSTDISSTEKLYFDHIKDAYLRMTKSEFPIISVINNEVMKDLSPLNPIAEKIWAAIDQQVSSLDNSNYGGN